MIRYKRKFTPILKILLHLPLLLLAYILQDMIFTRLEVFGARPLVLPVAVAAVAMFEGSVRGGIFGLAAGILCDASLGQPAVLFTILLTVCGLTVGILGETVLARGFPSFLTCCTGTLVLCVFCQALPLLIYAGAPIRALAMTALAQLVYSILFALPVYRMARTLSRLAGA